ncbi:MAG TPA: secretin N-terminal domain-containing protein, partial [Candidatus Sulfopaludibacter sp.]|nr:secretin N-terminal domain-containing protein [Candidatus Sulfopaludibacter sp.]
EPHVQKVFILKYADPRNLAGLLQVFDANVHVNADLHALAVSGSPQTLQAIEEAINKLDTPAAAVKDVVLTMQLVVGTDTEGAVGGPIPKDLDKVVAELRDVFPFKNYRLMDVLTLRTRIGQRAGTESSGGAMQFGSVTKPVVSNFNFNTSSLGPDGTTVRLEGLRAQSQIPVEASPGQYSRQDLTLTTDVDIKEGQKVVIGRRGINKEQALFLVLSAHVVQ